MKKAPVFALTICLLTTISLNAVDVSYIQLAKDGEIDLGVAQLIKGKQQLNAKDFEGKTLLMYAAEKGIQSGGKFSKKHLNTIIALVESGADTSLRDNDGMRAYDIVYNAVMNGILSDETIKALNTLATSPEEEF